jgi:hypothetical protein
MQRLLQAEWISLYSKRVWVLGGFICTQYCLFERIVKVLIFVSALSFCQITVERFIRVSTRTETNYRARKAELLQDGQGSYQGQRSAMNF